MEKQNHDKDIPEARILSQEIISPKKIAPFKWWLPLAIGGVGTIIVCLILSAIIRNSLLLYPSTPSNNPVNQYIPEYREVLDIAVKDASSGWMVEKTINANGCVIEWNNSEYCNFNAFLRYRSDGDADNAMRQLRRSDWRELASNSDDSYKSLGEFQKTINGKQVSVYVSKNTEDGSVYANIIVDIQYPDESES